MDTALHVAGELAGARDVAKPPSPDAIITVILPAVLDLLLAWPEQPATEARCGTVAWTKAATVPAVGTLPRRSWHAKIWLSC